ncbi:uncharacterized protein HMPREF1541_07030 [Cyphellophora europaea CBS 101466]|uniref:Heterokaryon incompatibility domain-containing protein n=1 Tax=Cyphellophora europaea (strain CBS 101466) TaxID=1220924 RepID=W2RTC7_CYPE1|nr:uncharacterized protein HMPREF1541_07030 [Cyphellophora europaea CBS 101466]ETN38988.1 hypothetical protein HMPREF1541_07030 [Cyphellophora europaea CBS 101466]
MASHYQHGGTDRYTYEPPTSKTRYTRHWMQHLRDGTAFKVTDERDRVYGIFGMISSATNRMDVEYRADIKPQDFPIDYSKSVSEVYQDVIKFLINTDRNLDCLVVVEDRRTRFMSKDLPSWVTDWRQHQPRSLPNLPPDRDNELRQYGQPPRQDLAAVGRLMLEGVVEFEVLTLSAAKVSDWWDVDGLPIKQVAEFVPRVLQRTWALDGALDTICSSYMKCASHMDNPCSSNIGKLGPWYYVPKTARIGDIVVSLSGSSHRFVLREARAIASFSSPTAPCYKLVGLAFPAQESWPSRPTGVLQTFILI